MEMCKDEYMRELEETLWDEKNYELDEFGNNVIPKEK